MAEFDLTIEIENQLGIPYPSGDDPNKKLTLGEVCTNALAVPMPNDIDTNKKMRRGALSVRLGDHMRNGAGTPFHLTAEDITMIKECIGATFAPVVVFRTIMLLDPPPAQKH